MGVAMKIIVLGSGTGVPMADRGSPCFLLITGADYTLFDLGPGSLRRLLRAGVPHDRIDRVFFTHFHPDHTADLVHFLFATRDPSILEKRRPFVLAGATGLREFLERLRRSYGRWLDLPPDLMGIDEMEITKPDRRNFAGNTLLSQPLKHTPNSLAYRVETASGSSFVYSGDTGYSEELIGFAEKTDLLILECSFPEKDKVDRHLTPSLAGRIAAKAGAKKLLLVHFFPEVLSSDITGQCRLTFGGELILGRDFLHLDLV